MLLWLCGTAEAPATPQTLPIVVEHLSTADGLPQSTVHAVLQDSQGFVWIGTEDGLVRYDGHELFRYAYSPTARDGLPGSFIQAIVEDANHDLWIAVKDSGIARWDRATDRFTVYRHEASRAGSLAGDDAIALDLDDKGRLWVGESTTGIDILNPATGRIDHRAHDPSDANSLVDNRVTAVYRDRSGRMWVGTMGGLAVAAPDGRSFTRLKHREADTRSLSGDAVSSIKEDRLGNFWVGTYDAGLNHLDSDGTVIAAYRHHAAEQESLRHDDVRAILEDGAGRVWIGTADGLDLYNPATGRFVHYRHDDRDARSLNDSEIISLYEDSAGLLWIGTRAGGVDRWNPRSWELGGYRPDWLAGRPVTAFADAPNHKLWVGSLGGGLMLFDPATGESVSSDRVTGRHNAIDDMHIMSLLRGSDGSLWIGTRDHGLRRLSADGRVTSFPVKPGDSRAVSAAGIMTLFESHDGRIWVGTHGGGANVIDPATGLVRQLPYDASVRGALSSANIGAFGEDAQGNLWIGNDGNGLDLADSDGAVITSFRHEPGNAGSLSANSIYAVTVDQDGRVWVGTDGGGLNRVVGSSASPGSIRFLNLSQAQGLTSDTIYSVLTDPRGQLWMSGNAGLMRYDPRSGAVRTFHVEQGLQSEEFESGAYLKMRDGRMCFGGPGGFNLFNPSALTERRHPPRLALMRLDVLGAPVESATPYWLLDHISLNDRASIVSLDFGTLDFASPKHTRLAYRLPGLANQWIDLGSQHRVTLTNLDAGDHVLEVRAASAESSWSDTPLRIRIHRDPLPWRSSWAYAAYVLCALVILAGGLWQQRRKIRQGIEAQLRLEREVAARTSELHASNVKLEEAAKAKSDFLARMSHELRTPMNGVIGMAELLETTPQSAEQSRLTKTIRSSAGVLLRIVNDLLDLSKAQVGKIEFESLPFDLLQLVEESAALLSAAAAAKGLELTVCPPEHPAPSFKGDPLRIRQILLNLIGNAIKFTERGDISIETRVGAGQDGRATVEMSVADTGIGMTEAAIAKIFDPFTQADESMSRRFGGTGLGLAICRELVTLMGGTITVASRPGSGSTFTVMIPLALLESTVPANDGPLKGAVRIVTRKPLLERALERHARQLGLTVRLGAAGHGAGEAAEVLLVDAGSLKDFLAGGAGEVPSWHGRLLLVASSNEMESIAKNAILADSPKVSKPVQRDALLQALAVALGTRPAFTAPANAPTRTMQRPKGHVLIVEDDPVNAEVAQGYLRVLGCSSTWASSGTAAVARASAERFDLILMDLNMPDLDGFATAGLIRRSGGASHGAPIIALTAHEEASYRDACLTAGLDDILSKPYGMAECAAMLERWLARKLAVAAPKARATPAPTTPLDSVDMAVVAGLRNLASTGHGDLYSRLVDLFQRNSPQDLAGVDALLAAGDCRGAAAICHKLKASAANMGAVAFAYALDMLESLCRDDKTADARQHFQEIALAHPRLVATLRGLKLQASA